MCLWNWFDEREGERDKIEKTTMVWGRNCYGTGESLGHGKNKKAIKKRLCLVMMLMMNQTVKELTIRVES